MQTVKNALKAMGTTAQTLKQNVNEFLRQYKNAPHGTTNVSPSHLFLGRQLRTRFDLIRPEQVAVKVTAKQFLKSVPDYRVFGAGDCVYFLTGNMKGTRWLKGTILNRVGDLHYTIRYDSKIIKRHVNQIRRGNKKLDIPPHLTNRSANGHNAQQENCEQERNSGHGNALLTTPNNVRPTQPVGSDEMSQNMSVNGERDSYEAPSSLSMETPASTLRGFATPSPPSEVQTKGQSDGEFTEEVAQPPLAPRRSTRPRKRRVLFSP